MDPITGVIVKTAAALSEPARLAVEKLAGGISQLYKPTHVRRMAKAEVDAAFIKAVGDQDVAALLKAARHRQTYRKIRQELNLKLIADRASHHFEETTMPPNASPPADEWVDEFTDQCKDASTDELRELWARLYVAETKQSGTVPRRILRVVRDLDAQLARSFTSLLSCCATADDGRMNLLAFNGWSEGVGLTWRNVRELEDVGLVQIPALNSVVDSGNYLFNQDRVIQLTFSDANTWSAKIIPVTSTGIAIAGVVEKAVNEPYVKNFSAAAEKAGAKVQQFVIESPLSGEFTTEAKKT